MKGSRGKMWASGNQETATETSFFFLTPPPSLATSSPTPKSDCPIQYSVELTENCTSKTLIRAKEMAQKLRRRTALSEGQSSVLGIWVRWPKIAWYSTSRRSNTSGLLMCLHSCGYTSTHKNTHIDIIKIDKLNYPNKEGQ